MKSTCIIDKYGNQRWKSPDGEMHRLDGPAYISANGNQEWWVHRVNVTDQVKSWMIENNIAWPWDAATQLEFVMRFT